MELLLLLADRPGQLVTREEILERLWGKGVFLDADNSINTAISKVRAALKDDPENPAYIKTVPGKGYRFVAPIAEPPADVVDAPADSAQAPPARRRMRFALAGTAFACVCGLLIVVVSRVRTPAADVPSIRSLAVLPLENLTGDPGEEYFADGMTDALITDLAQITSLRVISRTSITRYKGVRQPLAEIARELGVDAIVEGTVTRSAGRVRITSQLIYAPRDQHVWARSYERDVGDVVALQADIAQSIAAEVRAALTTEQRVHLTERAKPKADAYEAFLRGQHYWNQRTSAGVKKSLELFQQSVESDPDFAPAYAGLADAYNFATVLNVLPATGKRAGSE